MLPDKPSGSVEFLPRTRRGRISAGLLAVAVAAFLFVQVLVASGERGGDTFTDNWRLSGAMGVAGLCILLGALVGLVAVWRDHERSVLVFVSIGIGALAALFLLGEFLIPH